MCLTTEEGRKEREKKGGKREKERRKEREKERVGERRGKSHLPLVFIAFHSSQVPNNFPVSGEKNRR